MASSLAKLVGATDKDDFKITQNSFNPQPIKKRLYGSLGSEDCRPIILRECIDKQKLAYILEYHNQFELGTNFRDGQKSDKETQLSLLRIYLSMLNQNGERPPALQCQLPALLFVCVLILLFVVFWSGEPKQNQGRGLVDRKLVQAPLPPPPPPPPPPPSKFTAGRPKAALLFWFFGGSRCGIPLFIVMLVIY